MKLLILCLLFIPLSASARFIFQYDLNYSSEKDDTQGKDYEKNRTFHKVFLGAAVNGAQTLFFGWNVNSWSSALTYRTNTEETYSMTEMGPKLQWFFSEDYNWYIDAEWNPYAKGEREKDGTKEDISGSSMSFGMGYRFKLSRLIGLGASIHHHSLSVKESKVGSTVNDVTDKVTNLMPMLELSIITR